MSQEEKKPNRKDKDILGDYCVTLLVHLKFTSI